MSQTEVPRHYSYMPHMKIVLKITSHGCISTAAQLVGRAAHGYVATVGNSSLQKLTLGIPRRISTSRCPHVRHATPLAASTSSLGGFMAVCLLSLVHVMEASAQEAPRCPLGKCVRYSSAPVTPSAAMVPSPGGYRVSISSIGDLSYTSGTLSTPTGWWVRFRARSGLGRDLVGLGAASIAWDISPAAIVGSSRVSPSVAMQQATAWDLGSAVGGAAPVAAPQPLPSGGVHESAITGIADAGFPARLCGWASTVCAQGFEDAADQHAFVGWFPPLVSGSSQWLGELSGDGCLPIDESRAGSVARHTNQLGYPVGFLYGSPSSEDPCTQRSVLGPYALPFLDPMRWQAILAGTPGVPTRLARLQTPNGAVAERTSEGRAAVGWAGYTANGACGQSSPIPSWLHGVLWNTGPAGLPPVVDLHALTLPVGTSSVAASAEETVPPNLGLTIGGERYGTVGSAGAAIVWRECFGWTAIDVADFILEAGDPSGSPYSSGSMQSYEVSLGRCNKFQIITDIIPQGIFAGFMDGRPFAVTRFEDLDSDLRVDSTDLSMLLSSIGSTPGSSGTQWDTRDLNRDGVIDARDLSLLLSAYSGAAVVVFPDICNCAALPVEERMSFDDAIHLSGFDDTVRFGAWLREQLLVDPDLAEWQVSSIVELMFERREL